MKVKSPVYHLYTVNITIDPIKSAVWLDLIPHIHMYIYIYSNGPLSAISHLLIYGIITLFITIYNYIYNWYFRP